jgi:hypothetical protein
LVAKIFGYVYLVVGILGLFINDVLGLIHLTLVDTIIHFVVAIIALYVGYKSTKEVKNNTFTA